MTQSDLVLWPSLQRAGLVQGEAPEAGQVETPWFVKVLLAISGWLAALFILGFIGAAFILVFRNNVAAFITGSALIGVAYALIRIPKNEFIAHMALAISLAGQILFFWGLFRVFERQYEASWAMIAVLEICLAVFIPNFVHRVISTLIAAVAFHIFLILVGAHFMFSGLILIMVAAFWLNEFRWSQHMDRFRAMGYGLVLALIPLKGSLLFQEYWWRYWFRHKQTEVWVQPWMGELLCGVALLYVIWQLLIRYRQPLQSHVAIAALVAGAILSFVSIEAQGITVGLTIVLLGFSNANRVLLGLGILSLLFYISSYYYLLNDTLLAKAQTLLVIGLVLLAARWLMTRLFPVHGETQNVQ